MTNGILLDTSYIVALLDRSDKNHRRCVEVINGLNRIFLTCEAVLAEACYLLRNVPKAFEAILGNVEIGTFRIPWQILGHEKAIMYLMKKYADVPMDLADACLVAMADQLALGDILTLDSDFEAYRWNKRKAFNIFG